MNGCLCGCMLSLGTCTQVCMLTKVHKVNLCWWTKLLSVTTDTVSWTEVCHDSLTLSGNVSTAADSLTKVTKLSPLTTLAKSNGKLVLGTCVLIVIRNNLVTTESCCPHGFLFVFFLTVYGNLVK